ncbi:MAG: hypothetical protein H6812_05500 [Phycisphaeraceae bacterium]|nr:hypothetical protein [Phycisphaerales bacterium]MCB9842697.1 hypothetical protein [Phycisphaeraceae bacterium]
MSDDPDVQLDETNYWLGKHGFEWAAKEPAICRAVLKRLPKASPSAIVDFFQSLDDFYESPILEMGIPYLIDAALEGAKRRDGGGFVLASLQAISRLRPQDIDDATLAAWESASTYPEVTTRRSAIGYGAGLAPEQAGIAIGWYLADQDPENARRAWLLMAFLDPISGYSGNWREGDETVAAAILYAAAVTSGRVEFFRVPLEEDPEQLNRIGWVLPFLDRVEELALDASPVSAAIGDDLMERVYAEIEWIPAEEEARKMQARQTRVWALIQDFSENEPGSEQILRYLFVDHPLPDVETMTPRQHEFASALLAAWWEVSSDDYSFDEEAKVFRRIEQDEKGPE